MTDVYRSTVHPLSEYPGLLVGRVTDWYCVYHAYKGDGHLSCCNLHQGYGLSLRREVSYMRELKPSRQICAVRSESNLNIQPHRFVKQSILSQQLLTNLIGIEFWVRHLI